MESNEDGRSVRKGEKAMKMNIRLLVSIFFIFALFSSALVAAQEHERDESAPSTRSLQIDDTFKIKSVRSPSLSPDGKPVECVSETDTASRVTFTATPDRAYVVSIDHI